MDSLKFQPFLVGGFGVITIDNKKSKQSICTVFTWKKIYRHLLYLS